MNQSLAFSRTKQFTYQATPEQAEVEDQAGSIHAWLEKQGYSLDSVSIRSDGTILVEADDIPDIENTIDDFFIEQSAHAVDERQAKLDALASINLEKPTLELLRDAILVTRELLLEEVR